MLYAQKTGEIALRDGRQCIILVNQSQHLQSTKIVNLVIATPTTSIGLVYAPRSLQDFAKPYSLTQLIYSPTRIPDLKDLSCWTYFFGILRPCWITHLICRIVLNVLELYAKLVVPQVSKFEGVVFPCILHMNTDVFSLDNSNIVAESVAKVLL